MWEVLRELQCQKFHQIADSHIKHNSCNVVVYSVQKVCVYMCVCVCVAAPGGGGGGECPGPPFPMPMMSYIVALYKFIEHIQIYKL